MAKFRQVHVEFWQDGFVLDLTPEEKYFYLYLMTNSKTSQCGIYELPKRIIETETGYNRETVDKLLQRFIDYGKIKYSEVTKEVFIVNWIKYNMIKSSKVIACIKKELEQVKNKEFVEEFITLCKQYGYPIDTVSIPYPKTMGNNNNNNNKKNNNNNNKEEQENLNVVVVNPFSFYQENFGVISPFISDSIQNWIDDLGEEVVIEAMKRALKQQKKWNYAEGILQDWVRNNVRSLTDIEAYEADFKRRRQGKAKIQGDTPEKVGPDIPREYVYDIHAGEDWP